MLLSKACKFSAIPIFYKVLQLFFLAGKAMDDDELEEIIEGGNPTIFTQGVSTILITTIK